MSIALSQVGARSSRSAPAEEPPIHWPSAAIGLLLAVGVVVGVSWFASVRRPGIPVQQVAAAPAEPPPQVAPTPIPAAAAQVAPAPAERVRVTQTRGLGVNLRGAAGERAARIKTLPEGTQLEIVGQDERADGMTWRNVRDPSGAVGWVAASFVAPVVSGR